MTFPLSVGPVLGRWALGVGMILIFVVTTPATAQQYTIQEAGLDGGGGVRTSGSLRLTSSLSSAPVGTVQTGRYVLYSAMPSPFAGRAAIVVIHDPGGNGDDAAATGGQDRSIIARILTNEAPLDGATLYYRAGTAPEPTAVVMEEGASGFTATIPGSDIGAAGLTYYFTATDAAGTTIRAPRRGVYSLPVQLNEGDLRATEPQPGGTTQAAYRLLSMPIVLEDPRPTAVLGDNIPTLASASAYDPSEARFFEPIGTRVAEFPRTSDFDLGRAFWLIVRGEGAVLDAGPGTVNPLNEPVDIALSQGWNFVGTPFTVPVPVTNLQTSSGAPVTLRAYGADGYNTPDNPVTEMAPFSGYAVFAESATTLTVQPPLLSDGNGKTNVDSTPAAAFAWRLRIRGTSRTGRDGDNVAAVRDGAVDEWDPWDWPEPPSMGSGLSITFDPPDGSPPNVALSTDVRRVPTHGTIWPLTVHTEAAGPVRLSVEGTEQLPAHLDAWLLDTATKDLWNLRQSAQARLTVLAEGTERALRLVVGTTAYVKEMLRDLEALPQVYTLNPPYPNPSTGTVAFQVGVPEDEEVSVEVYNILGQRVATLKNREPMVAGFHTLVWDAPRLASGVYFVRMEAGPYRETQKLVRIR
ncbi:T9SS type A sorting domain-containing protein [Salinibacter sp. 10B]|uniref:T9SS type A sorting domain-containing protein n=1 Tax=Salinibacter sp. 10B TaxID=1923971 RepID=UPI000CF4A6C2|nr:T9SS type A sorting domain-containing protein [Salinibacter sp. 10B]